jgi:glyoxylase-like metal-dependent hydrolase (beta-lactamase superfamily II)
MRRKICAIATCLSLVLIGGQGTHAQQTKSLSQRSYERARQILDQAVAASGDVKSLEALGDISIKFSAKVVEINQSASPTAPYYVTQANGIRLLDFRGKRSYQELNTHFLGDIPLRLKEVVTEKDGFTIELTSNAVFPVAKPALTGSSRAAQRWFPQYLFQTVLNRAFTLRWLGEENYEGQKQQVVSFNDADGNQLALYFDQRTHLLTKVETLGDSAIFGVATSENIFSNYRRIGGVEIPSRLISRFSGELITDLSYTDVQFNTHPADSLFEMPTGAELGPETGGQPSLTVTHLAPDLYYVNHGLSLRGNFCLNNIFFYSSMFVVFKDYVLVIESPLGDRITQAVIAKIKETAPNKPIKYVVPTHYHSDHLGGVRGYIAEGTTVVTTPGNKSLVEKMASTQLPFNPDTLSRKPRPPLIETFTDKRVFTDAEHTVEFYNIGGPHADEMVIAYFPKEKIVFASDVAGIFAFQPKGQIVQANAANVDFVKKIERLGLQVETIASGHGRIGKMDELRKSVEQGAASK